MGKKKVLARLEDVAQALGEWSEETDDKLVYRVIPTYIERIDSMGKEIKQIKENKKERGSMTENLI